MNFPTCPSVTEAVMKRVQHPAFGYFCPSEEYYDSIIRWQEDHFGVTGLKKEHIGYENGVHGFVTSAVQVLSEPGDKILLHSPFYLGFREDIEGLGRVSVHSPLKRDSGGIWRMDYEDMDRKLKENHIHLAIFCSPHNPTGRVWERWELERAMEVYEANDCYVISDEIWATSPFAGHRHIPTQMTNDWAREHVAAAYAPSKTFNLAGLIGSFHVIYSSYLRDRICGHANATHYNKMNVLSMHAPDRGVPAGRVRVGWKNFALCWRETAVLPRTSSGSIFLVWTWRIPRERTCSSLTVHSIVRQAESPLMTC